MPNKKNAVFWNVNAVRIDDSEESSVSIIRVTRVGEVILNVILGSPILVTLMTEAILSSETSGLTRATVTGNRGTQRSYW
jgi:hypothetical protein